MQIRCLRAEELDKWLDFVASCFAEKGTPRAYFQRHVANDEDFDPSLVLVALDQEDHIHSTLRIFKRRVQVAGQWLLCGGIGEVCTAAAQRRQGLAGQLLAEAVQLMRNRGFQLSLLHSSRLQPFYAKHDWQSVPTEYYQLQVDLPRLQSVVDSSRNAADPVCRLPEHKPPWPALAGLWESAARRRQWQGYCDRSSSYWQRWVAEECQQLHCTLTWLTDGSNTGAYMATKLVQNAMGTTLYIREFAAEASDGQENERFFQLLLHAIRTRDLPSDTVTVNVAAALAEKAWLARILPQEAEVSTVVDQGWMYQVLSGPIEDHGRLKAAVSEGHRRHCFLNVDAF